MARLFISQERLTSWSDENRIKLSGEVMTLIADGRSFRLTPAVRFMRVAGGNPDANGVVGKVRALAALAGDGAEHVMSSVIYKETAYDVQQGYLGEPMATQGS